MPSGQRTMSRRSHRERSAADNTGPAPMCCSTTDGSYFYLPGAARQTSSRHLELLIHDACDLSRVCARQGLAWVAERGSLHHVTSRSERNRLLVHHKSAIYTHLHNMQRKLMGN